MPQLIPNHTIISWNGRGIRPTEKITELRACAKKLKPAIIFVQESHLTSEINPFIKHYYVIRVDRTAHGGGLCAFIRSCIHAKTLPAPNLRSIEALAITVKINNRLYNLINIYIPRNSKFIKSDLKKIFRLNNIPWSLAIGMPNIMRGVIKYPTQLARNYTI